MRTPIAFIFFLSLTVFSAARAADLNVPIVSTSHPNLRQSFVPAISRRTCEAVFTPQTGISPAVRAAWKKTIRIIQASNLQFLRRGWTLEFLKERFKLARLVSDRSEYFAAENDQIENPVEKIVGTIGFTWAEYTRDTLPLMNAPVEQSSRGQFLPGEISLESNPFPRPLTSSGDGIVIELRTWSIDKTKLGVLERSLVFAEILAGIVPKIFKKIAAYPELYDQPILYTYGDETSLGLYGRMGFKKLTAEPIVHEGSNWWLLAITPRKLEAFLGKIHDPTYLKGLNQELEVWLPQGKFKIESSGAVLGGPIQANPNGISASHLVNGLAQATEVAPLLWVEKGGMVSWTESQLRHVGPIERAYHLDSGLVAGKGSNIVWDSDGRLQSVSRILFDAEVDTNLVAAADSAVTWSMFGDQHLVTSISQIKEAYEMIPGVWAAPDSLVSWNLSLLKEKTKRVPMTISKLLYDAKLPDGPVASAGSFVSWRENDKGAAEWEYISRLAKPFLLPDGRVAPAGAKIDRSRRTKGVIVITQPPTSAMEGQRGGTFVGRILKKFLRRP